MNNILPPLLRLLLGLLLLWSTTLHSEPVAIVTQDGTPLASLSKQEAADLFLGKRKLQVAGQPLTPVDVADEGLRDAFYQGVADMSSVRVNAYWARLVFSAQGRPPRKLPLVEAQALVQSQPGMVTYLPGNGTSGFKILLRLP